ncbi:amino acid adenylation domain protein [Francisella philomiragia subsp. philomiragia ATCC 25015]|uniref:non-ribosomal peptide synthetase n=1 Tax=Francisella philomiragia TaxID=28110 RepID=UPI0005A567EE|nr:non-ribosomal peptide synthetase [Francisella philomiragia]AJI74261.1 amino acid adenylation domain protein [Francisella philomiragia subsp. philomiragia ATCC 25015]
MTKLSQQEYQTIVYDWNQTDSEYPRDKTIYELFEEQVKQNPNNIALVFEDKQLTYQELNNKSNQLARYIRKQYKEITSQELEADTLIPLCLKRSLDMVIAILAVMKAGCAYVPMDPEYPQERFKHILSDTDAKLIITQSHLKDKLSFYGLNIESRQNNDIGIITTDTQEYLSEGTDNLPQYSQAEDLAYVIYTSGTTGVPKGVMIEHKSLSSFLLGMLDRQLSGLSSYNVLSLTEYVFDIFALEYGIPLMTGSFVNLSTITDVNEEILSGIDMIQQTPTTLSLLYQNYNLDLSDKFCLVGGEYLQSLVSKKLRQKFKNVINVYGPTESTVWSSSYVLQNNNTSIGKPLSNEKIYILDQHMIPVPIGVVGELYIGGAGLARGYLNRPELTAERFVSNPFATESDRSKGYTRLYKTGDLVRWLADGNIEYIGRNDDQVKIRGYRIELGEIENQLSSIAGIKQSCVLAKQNKENDIKYLVGYYVADKDSSLTQESILTQLAKVLPEYMLPSILVELESMPLTVNGKLDRRALPDPEFVNEDSYVVPTTELEITLCDIFAEVLGLEKVGVTDDFFRIGGNSILAIKLASKVTKVLDINISVADIFIYKNVSKLSSYISNNEIDNIVISQANIDKYALSFAQERLWFIEQYEKELMHIIYRCLYHLMMIQI